MTERHEVPGVDGTPGWIELRAADDVPERLRQPLKIASLKLGKYPAIRKQAELQAAGQPVPDDLNDQAMIEMGDGGGELAFAMSYLNILARVQAWSFGTVDESTLLDLPGRVFDAIEAACGSPEDLSEDLSPNADPESPTQPSTA